MVVRQPARNGSGLLSRQHGLFAVMSLIWGLTWVAIHTGVAALPPFFFAAQRLLVAGSVVLVLDTLRAHRRGSPRPRLGHWPRLVAASLLIDTACYGCLFWGMRWVPSGISAVVNLSLMPVGLFALGIVLREEVFSFRKLGAVVVGVVGLVVLFLPELHASGTEPPRQMVLAGMTAIVAGTLAACLGAILSRPLLRSIDALALGGLQHLIGGTGLLVLSLAIERIDRSVLVGLLQPRVLASGLFLALGGSVAAFTIYLTLLRDWGPSRAGSYAFVSPVVALIVGVAFLDETPGVFETAGSLVLLAATALALPRALPAGRRPVATNRPIASRPAMALASTTNQDQGGLAS